MSRDTETDVIHNSLGIIATALDSPYLSDDDRAAMIREAVDVAWAALRSIEAR